MSVFKLNVTVANGVSAEYAVEQATSLAAKLGVNIVFEHKFVLNHLIMAAPDGGVKFLPAPIRAPKHQNIMNELLIGKLESIATKLYDVDESGFAAEIYWSIRNLISELKGQL